MSGRLLRTRRTATRNCGEQRRYRPAEGKALLGFRVPTVIASPFTRGVE
jgi:hypothetical protein